MGEKIVRRVPMPEGVTATISTKQKDELIVDGNDIQLVSQAGMLCFKTSIIVGKSFFASYFDQIDNQANVN